MGRLLRLVAGTLLLPVLAGLSRGADPQQAADEAMLRHGHIGLAADDLLAFLRAHTLTAVDRAHVQALVEQLGDPSYPVRDQATRQLKNAPPGALTLLHAALQDASLERRRRAGLCILVVEGKTSAARVEAAVRLVKVRKLNGATTLLTGLLDDATDPGVRAEARSALGTLAGRNTPDCSPTRRAHQAAAQFLGAFAHGDWPSVRKLTGVPFALGGNLSVSTQAEFDDLFRPVLLERKHPNKNMVFALAHVIRGADYPAQGFEKEFLAAFPVHELRAVYATSRIDNARPDNGAVFVRLTPNATTVIGLGQYGPPATPGPTALDHGH